jgi:hypothetical protein
MTSAHCRNAPVARRFPQEHFQDGPPEGHVGEAEMHSLCPDADTCECQHHVEAARTAIKEAS